MENGRAENTVAISPQLATRAVRETAARAKWKVSADNLLCQ